MLAIFSYTQSVLMTLFSPDCKLSYKLQTLLNFTKLQQLLNHSSVDRVTLQRLHFAIRTAYMTHHGGTVIWADTSKRQKVMDSVNSTPLFTDPRLQDLANK